MTADKLEWPGCDKDRALQAVWHLLRAVQLATWITPASRFTAFRMGMDHWRNARGYLGAIGFERGAGLWR